MLYMYCFSDVYTLTYMNYFYFYYFTTRFHHQTYNYSRGDWVVYDVCPFFFQFIIDFILLLMDVLCYDLNKIFFFKKVLEGEHEYKKCRIKKIFYVTPDCAFFFIFI